jgi:hypothetical protein
LRIHSTSAMGLPRIVPAGGAEICGRWFPEGTTVSVPVSSASRCLRGRRSGDADDQRPANRPTPSTVTLPSGDRMPMSTGQSVGSSKTRRP